jgi:hypothetical protein
LGFDKAQHAISDWEDGGAASTLNAIVMKAKLSLAAQAPQHWEQAFKMSSARIFNVLCLR